jgi:hypothetical protein
MDSQLKDLQDQFGDNDKKNSEIMKNNSLNGKNSSSNEAEFDKLKQNYIFLPELSPISFVRKVDPIVINKRTSLNDDIN